jgi:hypothetical protein
MNCYIFGAGASKCYSDSPTGQKMPLAAEFFKIFNKLKISSNPWVLVGSVINYVRDNYGIEPIDFVNFNENIELIHSEIHEKFINAKSKNDLPNMIKYNAANVQLTFMFVSAINEIQNGPISDAHINFVRMLNENDSIITFNWDILLDRALANEKKWTTDTGYSIVPKQIYRNCWVEPQNIKSNYDLIKLHGSTNWLTSYPIFDKGSLKFTHTTGDHDVFVYESTIDEYACYDGRYMNGYLPFSYGYYPPNLYVDSIKPRKGHLFARVTMRHGMNVKGTAPHNGLDSMPLIITPIKNKEYDRFGDLFEILWKKSQEKLEGADKIFIIGYSFPKTDIRTNELFISAFSNRTSIPEIIIINPYPDQILDKFIFEFGIPRKKIIIDKCFIDEKYNFNKWKNT